MSTVKAWAAFEPGAKLKPFNYEMTPLTAEEVEIEVEYCGLCHTDVSFIKNEWGTIPFPLVPGHEITGKVVAMGDVARQKGLKKPPGFSLQLIKGTRKKLFCARNYMRHRSTCFMI